MAETIGRVEFIVGLDGKGLAREAREQGAKLAAMGKEDGERYGGNFSDEFGDEFDQGLSKAARKALKKWGDAGDDHGGTYGTHMSKAAIAKFKTMQKKTIEALSSKEGFKEFAKGFDTVDDAVLKLEKNVRRLSKHKVAIFDEDGVRVANQYESFFKNFEAGGALSQVKKWSDGLKDAEEQTIRSRDANEALRVNFDRLKASVDNVSFDKLAKNMGSAEAASARLRGKMDDLAVAGGVTEREYNRFNITLEKQVERYNAAAKAAQDKIDKDRDAEVALAKLTKQNEKLDRAMLSIENRMGDSKTFARYVKSVGSVETAHKRLGGDIDKLTTKFGVNDRSVGRLRRSLTNMVDGIQNAAGAATEASSGGFSKLTQAIQKMAGNKGGMSIGTIVVLIGSLGAAIGALGSAASAALVGLISSLGVAIVGLGAAAGAAAVGLVWMFMKASDAIGMMADEFPRAQKGMDALADAAKADSAEFARQWGPALADFTEKLAQLWRDDKMGEMAGKALGKITEAFTAVISSPAYLAFQTAMETTIPNSLVSLGNGAASLVEGLLLIFAEVGPMLEEMMGQFEAWAQSWEDTIKTAAGNGELQAFFDLALDSITAVMDMLLSLGGLLGTVFTAGAPAGNAMLGMLTDLFDSLNAFLKSPEGQTQLQEWFDNGVKLFDILLDLIGQIGGQFGDMITPEIMEDTLSALSNLGDGLQVIFDLFQILGGLDIFGNLVAAFEALSAFVTPLVEPLSQIADAIGNLLMAAFEMLIPVLAAAGEVLAPLVEAFASIVSVVVDALLPVFEALTPVIVSLVEAFIPIAELIAGVVMDAFNALWPIIQVVIDFIVDLIDAIAPLIAEILPVVAALVEQFSAVLEFLWPIISLVANIITGILKVAFTIIIAVIKLVIDIVVALVTHFTDVVNFVTDTFTPIFEEFGNFIDDIWNAISDSIETAIDQILGFFRGIKKVVDDAIGWFQSLFGAANDAKGAADGAKKSADKSSFAFSSAGSQGVMLQFPPRPAPAPAATPQATGFQGDDPAVVPFGNSRRRSLSIDGGDLQIGGGRGARVVNIESGAIVVQGNMAPEATATMTVNRIAERIAG